MNFIQGIKDYFKNKRLKKLEKDILALRDKLQFDQRFMPSELKLNTVEAFTRRITEYRVWSMGNGEILRRFYAQANADSKYSNTRNYFWHKAPPTTRMIHCGVPGLISTRMADILFKNGIKPHVTVYKDGEGESLSEDKAAGKKANELMSELMKIIGLQSTLQTAATNESWGGHCFFKLSHDISVSRFPIVETYDITQAEVVKERGITKAIVFKRWYQHNHRSYRLDEIYSTNEDGDACITYRLFGWFGDKEKEVDLLSISQTAELFNVNGQGAQNGLKLDENNTFVYKGLQGMLAFEKPNKTPSLEFPESNYGASDYEGAVDSFDALDEVASGNVGEIRTNKTRRYIPETMIPRDPDSGDMLPFDEFADCYVRVNGDPDQDAKNEIKVTQVGDKTASFMEKWKANLSNVCNKAKISPFALGITWLEAVNPSAESQRERNKTTLDMRDGKLKLWKPMLEEMLLRILQLNAWIRGNTRKNTQVQQEAFADIDFTWENTTVQVDFGEYLEESVSEKLTVWGGAKSQHVASTEECVKQLHPDWTAKQVQDEVNLIRFEEGMSTDNPLTLPTLTGEDDEE